MNQKEKMAMYEEKQKLSIYENDCEAVYTLKECLAKAKKEVLISIYDMYRLGVKDYLNLPKLDSKKELEEFLFINLPEYFKEYISIFDIPLELKIDIENGKTKTPNLKLLSLGYMFSFKKNNENIYIFPEELATIFNNSSTTNSDVAFNKFRMYFENYFNLNGPLTKDDINKIIEFHKINIDEKSINKLTKELGFALYKNKYYFPKDFMSDFIDSIIELKGDFPVKLLKDNELMAYLIKYEELKNKIIKLINISEILTEKILTTLMVEPIEPLSIITMLAKDFSLNDKQVKKMVSIISDYEIYFRYWTYNGRTEEEYINEIELEKILMSKKPKSNSLKDCLAALPKDAYKIILEEYNLTESDSPKLIDSIIDNFNECIYYWPKSFVQSINNQKNIDYEEYLDIEDIKQGFAFIYKEQKETKYIFPKEIINIIKEIDLNDLQDVDQYNYFNSNSLYDIVSNYLRMNGIIPKEDLRKLLKEHHNYDLNIKELDELIEYMDLMIVNEKYYTCIDCIKENEAEELMRLKNEFPKCRVFEQKIAEIDEDFDFEITNYINEKIKLPFEQKNNLESGISFLIKTGAFSKNTFDQALKIENIELNIKNKKELIEIINKYKNKISVWTLNGYAKNEAQASIKSKIGRNEPCPCGSGKKYKNCCGK